MSTVTLYSCHKHPVTPLNAFLAKATVFNNPWETSSPSTFEPPPLFKPVDRRGEKSHTIAGNAAPRLFFPEVFTSSLEIPCNFVTAFLARWITYTFLRSFCGHRWRRKKKIAERRWMVFVKHQGHLPVLEAAAEYYRVWHNCVDRENYFSQFFGKTGKKRDFKKT